MRHLRSILYALVLAPAVWVLAGVGFTHDLTSRGRDFFTAESLSGLLLLIFSGILYAIMAFSPISPLGPTVAGAVFLGVTYWAWSDPSSYAGIWSPDVVKDGFDLSRPGYGLAALLAVPLLCTALSARRWARYEPPVLPIIGEIGRFRGSAKVAPGANVAAVETTMFRTAQAERTQLLRTTPAADATVALPTATPAATPAPAGPKVTAAGDDTTTVFTTTPAPEAPKTNKSSITANSTIAAEPGKTSADDDKTTVIPAQPTAKDKNDEATTVLTATTKDAPEKNDDATEPLKLPAP
ncbi:hypothetical protein [Actinoplanes sp. NPDC020271]|uniref:hypothetical protein n=1 Tax=Actinoplanes sp. NPDC020271 TaxID=3363896 RepID=UPI0037991382